MDDATTARSRVFFCRDPQLLEPPEKASRDACGAAWMRVRKPASGERRGTRGGSWTRRRIVDTRGYHHDRSTRAREGRARRRALPASRHFRAARCAFSTVSRVARSRGGGRRAARRRSSRSGRAPDECRARVSRSTRVTREPPRVSRALLARGRASTRTLPSHAGPRTRLMNIAAIARATRETTQETTGPRWRVLGRSFGTAWNERDGEFTKIVRLLVHTRCWRFFVNLTNAPRFLQAG